MEADDSKLILVTGATGFVASHCIQQLLQAGYKVRGTVRSLKNVKKNEFLFKLCPEKKENLTLVEADLLNKQSWDGAVQGCSHVLHVASPFIMGNPSEDQVVKPAVEGTLNVLEACLKHQVKKVVVTSSVAAVWYGNWDKVVNEDDWSIETACGSYEKSKLRAERLVWDFWRKHKGKLEIATICPGFIVGPCYTLGGGASEEMVTELMLNKVPGIPKMGFGVVDVRDVAFAHIKAMEIPNNDGQRYICVSESKWFNDMVEDLRSEFKPLGYKLPKTKLAKWMVGLASIFDKKARSIVGLVNKEMRVDNSKVKNELNVEFVPAKKALSDMAWSLIKLGAVPDKTKTKK